MNKEQKIIKQLSDNGLLPTLTSKQLLDKLKGVK